MSEQAVEQTHELTPEQRVFGDAFGLQSGQGDRQTEDRYFRDRYLDMAAGKTVWLSRIMDSENGVVADLFKDNIILATLEYDYDTSLASVYVTSEGGAFGDITLCDQVSFDDAVVAAEEFTNGAQEA